MRYMTPNIDRIAKEGVAFTDYYGQQSWTAGRAAFIGGTSPRGRAHIRDVPGWSATSGTSRFTALFQQAEWPLTAHCFRRKTTGSGGFR